MILRRFLDDVDLASRVFVSNVSASHAELAKVQVVVHEVHADTAVIDTVVLTFDLLLLLAAHLLVWLHRERVVEVELLLLLLLVVLWGELKVLVHLRLLTIKGRRVALDGGYRLC